MNYKEQIEESSKRASNCSFDVEKLAKKKSDFEKLKDRRVELTPEEKKIVRDSKAVWGCTHGEDGNLAVWKSVDKNGNATYITHTHRAYNTAPTLKGAISRFHKFIKKTASSYYDEIEKIAVQTMPYKLPNGSFAKPFGFGDPWFSSSKEMNNYLRKGSEEDGYLWDEVPDNLTPFASRDLTTLLHDGNGGVFSYREGRNQLDPQLTDNDLSSLYSTKEILTPDDMSLIDKHKLTEESVTDLFNNKSDDDLKQMGFKERWDVFELFDRMRKNKQNDDFLGQYKQASNYRDEIEKTARSYDIEVSRKKEKKEIRDVKRQHGLGTIGAIGAAIGSAPIASALGRDLIGKPNPTGEIAVGHAHGQQLTNRLRELSELAGIGNKYDYRATGMNKELQFIGPHFNAAKKYIDGGYSIPSHNVDSILAHEVGHASRSVAGKVMDRGLPITADLIGLGLALKPIRDKVRSLDGENNNGIFNKSINFVEKHPYLTSAGLFAGSILPRELAASGKAIKLLAKESSNPDKLKALVNATTTHGPTLGKALGNYVFSTGARSFGKGALINNSVKRNKIKDIKESYRAEKEKTASDYHDAIEKTARSFDARRKKQYTQLLKKMYGGTDEMVDTIKKTRDYGLWHGSAPENIPSIMKNGLRPSSVGYGGAGVYLGPLSKAQGYAQATGGTPNITRLKMPSEFAKDSKTLYPKTQKAMYARPAYVKKVNKDAPKELKNVENFFRSAYGENNPIAIDTINKMRSQSVTPLDRAVKTPTNPKYKDMGNVKHTAANVIAGKATALPDGRLPRPAQMRQTMGDQIMYRGAGSTIPSSVLKSQYIE